MTEARRPNSHRNSLMASICCAIGVALLAAPAIAAGAGAITQQMESVRKLETEIASHDARFNQASAAYQSARARLAQVRERISQNTDALKQARADFAEAQKRLAFRLSAVYRQPQPSGIEIILRSGSLSDAMSRIDFLERVQRQDGQIVVSVGEARDRIKRVRVQLLADQESAKRDSRETRTRLAEIRSIRAVRRGVLLAARRQLTVMIAAEAQRQAAANRLAALRAAQRRVSRRVTPAGTVQVPLPAPSSAGGGGGDVSGKLAQIALCESGGNPTAVSPSGLYRGKYQFDPETWKGLGGSGSDPAAAPEAEQDRVAALLYSQRGAAPWPVCGR